jgi:hypothetical protein
MSVSRLARLPALSFRSGPTASRLSTLPRPVATATATVTVAARAPVSFRTLASAATATAPAPSPPTPTPTLSPETRSVFSGADGNISVGPGYISYSGPAPEGDRSVASTSEGVITYARLRDCCPCPKCIHPSTRQKTHTSGEAARFVSELGNEVLDARGLHAATSEAGAGIEVHWPAVDGAAHSSFYPVSLLQRLTSQRVRGHTYLNDTVARRLWTARELTQSEDLWINYDELNAATPGQPLAPRRDVQLRLLEQLQVYGLAFVRGLPTDKTDNDDCRLREFAETIGGLRNTFYGETWNVKSVVNSKNVAYTNLNLGLHMDLL